MIRDWLTPDKINVINSIDNWSMGQCLCSQLMHGQSHG
jgi:hypothetical protein